MSSDELTKPPEASVTMPPKRGSFSKGVLAGAAVAAIAGHLVRPSDTEDRYPLRVEYEIAKACIDGSRSRLSYDQYQDKQELCLCALEGAIKEVNFEKYQRASKVFVSAFQEHTNVCTNKGRR